MNISCSNSQVKTNFFCYILIALAALMALYWFVNIPNIIANRGSLSTFSAQNTHADIQSEWPVPAPVPTPPTTQSQATPTPLVVAQSNPAPVPQPVPTPPANP